MPQVHTIIEEIDIRFKKRALEEGKIAVQNLDKEVIKLKNDALQLDKGSAQFAKLTSEIGKLTTERNKLQKAIDSGDLSFQTQSKGLSGLTNGLGLAGKALAGLGVAFGAYQIVNFIKSSIQAAAEIEKAAKAFEAFGIPAKEAFELANKIDNLAAKVPFESEEINRVAKNLIKFNVEAKQVPKIIEQISAVAKGADFSLESLSDAYGRANKNGVVFGRDFLPLYKNVPGLTDAIAKSMGKTNNEIVKLGKAGRITFDQFNAGIQEVTSSTGKYGQVLSQYQNSFDGILKQTKEEFGNILEETGKELLPSIKEGLKGLVEIAKVAIPIFVEIGKVIGAALSFQFQLAKAIGQIPGKIKEFYQAIKDGRVSFGGRFLIIDERRGTTELTEDMKKVIDNTISNLDQHIEKRSGENRLDLIKRLLGGKGTKPELTDEQKAALAQFSNNFQNEIKAQFDKIAQTGEGFAKIGESFTIEFLSENEKEKKLELIRAEARDQIKGLEKTFSELRDSVKRSIEKQKEEAQKLSDEQGVGFNVKPFEQKLNKAIADLDAKLEIARQFIEVKTAERLKREGFEVTIPITPIFKINEANEIDKTTQDIVKGFLDKIKSDVKSGKITIDKLPTIVVADKSKQSFLSRIFDLSEEEKVILNESLQTFATQALNAADTYIQAELDKTDFLINETQRRMDNLLSIQEGGNVDQINLEQERLDKLNAQRADFLEQQDALNKIQILGNNALAISEGILAVTKAFGSEGNLFVGIATSLALATTVAATIASLTADINSIPKFYEGTESVGAKSGMKPTINRARDRYVIAVDEDERVLTGSQNKKIPRSVKNERVPELINKGIIYETTFEKNVNKVNEFQRSINHVTEFVTINSRPGESIDKPLNMPTAKDMSVGKNITITFNTEKIERQQNRTNKLLEKIAGKEEKQNINVHIQSDNKEQIRLQKLAK